MNVQTQIIEYISSLPEIKQKEMQELHQLIIKAKPKCRLWFLDGKDDKGKIVSNPNIGYGFSTIKYKDGRAKDFYQVGLSANTAGISVYIMGIEDKKYLSTTFGNTIGKATLTSYCIKFKSVKDININVLIDAITFGFQNK